MLYLQMSVPVGDFARRRELLRRFAVALGTPQQWNDFFEFCFTIRQFSLIMMAKIQRYCHRRDTYASIGAFNIDKCVISV